MDRETFFEIYEDTVIPIINKIVNDNPDLKIKFVGNPYGMYEGYLLKKSSMRSVLKEQEKKDDEIEQNNESAAGLEGEGSSAVPGILDRHKIAACMTAVIIETHPLALEDTDEPDGSARYSLRDAHRLNEQLGFLCGIAVLSMYMAAESKKNKSSIETIRANLKDGFIFPPPINGTDCPDSLIRALYFSNISYGLNTILIASIYYLLEQYFYKCYNIKLEID